MATWCARRHLSSVDSCIWGCEVAETLYHVFWNCKEAQCIWSDSMLGVSAAALGLVQGMCLTDSENTFAHIFSAMGWRGAQREDRAHHLAVVSTTMYYIWANHNLKKHKEPTFSHSILIRKIKLEVAAIASHRSYSSSLSSRKPYPLGHLTSTWLPPPTGWLILNCDASCFWRDCRDWYDCQRSSWPTSLCYGEVLYISL
ncbi:hypothetical protein HPP92_022736 [Vanilla planifolia]|uniref:Reverse transcriptase zinc-binding domain-containing protein n=1 Tax=Vanilla planifolia TaxID=51239 RepID=A0A835PQ70_VANPL|nr:hypothetical protein HPP92_022736 [Vanilla planifolia]